MRSRRPHLRGTTWDRGKITGGTSRTRGGGSRSVLLTAAPRTLTPRLSSLVATCRLPAATTSIASSAFPLTEPPRLWLTVRCGDLLGLDRSRERVAGREAARWHGILRRLSFGTASKCGLGRTAKHVVRCVKFFAFLSCHYVRECNDHFIFILILKNSLYLRTNVFFFRRSVLRMLHSSRPLVRV